MNSKVILIVNSGGKSMVKQIYNKLVRDRIPDIILKNGERPITEVLDNNEYKKMLEGIKGVYEIYKRDGPFETEPNFFPTEGYVKVMQKCGILPKKYDCKTPIDPMAVDEKYFQWQDANRTKRLDKE